MKKGLLLLVFLIIVGCAKDEDLVQIDPIQEVPESLEIYDLIGIKLENTIVHEITNVKLESSGYYQSEN